MLTSEHHFSLFLCFSSEHMFSTQSLTQMMLGLLGLSTLHGLSVLRTGQGNTDLNIYVNSDGTLK